MQAAVYGNRTTAINRPEDSITTGSRPVLARSGMLVVGDRLTGSYVSQLFSLLALAPPIEERR
jgi:hypothetical protein